MTAAATIKGKRKAACAAPEPAADKPLIDRWGRPHSEAALRNWSPAAIKALGLRRADAEEAAR